MRNMLGNMVWFTLTTCVLMSLKLMSMLMSHTSLHLFVLSFALTCAYVAGEEQIMASQSLYGLKCGLLNPTKCKEFVASC